MSARTKRSTSSAETGDDSNGDESEAGASSNMRYRRQKRGGKGLRDIKTTKRNGPVIGTLCVHDGDDVLMISASGKIQRIRAADISVIGRNTQGVRIMTLDDGDTLVQIGRIPAEVTDDGDAVPATEDGER